MPVKCFLFPKIIAESRLHACAAACSRTHTLVTSHCNRTAQEIVGGRWEWDWNAKCCTLISLG